MLKLSFNYHLSLKPLSAIVDRTQRALPPTPSDTVNPGIHTTVD